MRNYQEDIALHDLLRILLYQSPKTFGRMAGLQHILCGGPYSFYTFNIESVTIMVILTAVTSSIAIILKMVLSASL